MPFKELVFFLITLHKILWGSDQRPTEQNMRKAIVFHVFIYQQQLLPLNATSIQSNKIWVLQSRNHAYLVHKLTIPLF